MSSNSITFTMATTDPNLPAVLALLGIGLPASAMPSPAPGNPVPAGSHVDINGLAVLDDAGAAIVADPRNASPPYLAGLRLLASKPNVPVTEMMKAVGAPTPEKMAGHKAATTKRVKTALGGKGSAVLFRVAQGKIVIAAETRQALARYFNLPVT